MSTGREFGRHLKTPDLSELSLHSSIPLLPGKNGCLPACLQGMAAVLRGQAPSLLLLCLTSWRTSQFHSVLLNFCCCCAVAKSFPSLCNLMTAAHQDSLSSTFSLSLLKFMSIELVMLPNHLILCCPLVLLPSIFPSIRVFSNESALHIRWPKYWSFSFSINPSNEYSGLISFRIDWFDLFVAQGTLKSLLQHNSKISVLHCSAFFMVQLSRLYMTWKNHSFLSTAA